MEGNKAGSSGQSADLTMAERSGVEQIVQQAVTQVLEGHLPQLREELVRRIADELPQSSPAAAAGASGENGAANLLKAVAAIQAGATQREILRALLDNTVRYSGRVALFVIKAGAATGGQGRGFTMDGDDTLKDFAGVTMMATGVSTVSVADDARSFATPLVPYVVSAASGPVV